MTAIGRPKRHYLGMNKMGHHAGVCLISEGARGPSVELLLKERLTRVKNDGGSIHVLLASLDSKLLSGRTLLAENTYGLTCLDYEEEIDRKVPYFEGLKDLGLARFTSRFNKDVRFLTHHYCHAVGAMALSPFEKSVIVVLDGGGNMPAAFAPDHPEIRAFPPPVPPASTSPEVPTLQYEACSVYLQDRKNLRCVNKSWMHSELFVDPVSRYPFPLMDGLGSFYNNAARFVFGSTWDSGKLMGLAALGKAQPISDRVSYFRALDWNRAFRGGSRPDWESSPNFPYWADIAASVQKHFEEELLTLLHSLKKRFPDYRNLILTGGCALNCTANWKVHESGIFESVYIPPNPSDEGIAFGAAQHLRLIGAKRAWKKVSMAEQKGCWGPRTSIPTEKNLRSIFKGHRILRSRDPFKELAETLVHGEVVAWFQGRSECGPRALGQRSLIANPFLPGIKDRLNREIKHRESFRPYGVACIWEEAHKYFEIPRGFDGPFMSFSPKVRDTYMDRLREVTHADGTCRIQTVRREQNPAFHRLLKEFARKTGFPLLINTSLNAMGEPILETLEDARKFLEGSPVSILAAGNSVRDQVVIKIRPVE